MSETAVGPKGPSITFTKDGVPIPPSIPAPPGATDVHVVWDPMRGIITEAWWTQRGHAGPALPVPPGANDWYFALRPGLRMPPSLRPPADANDCEIFWENDRIVAAWWTSGGVPFEEIPLSHGPQHLHLGAVPARAPSKFELNLHLEGMSKGEAAETRQVLTDFIGMSIAKGLIPYAMIGLVEDILNLRLHELARNPGPYLGLPPESTRRIIELSEATRGTLFVGQQSDAALFSFESLDYLVGGPGPILFQQTDSPGGPILQQVEAGFGQFIEESWETLAVELLIEILTIILILLPGGHGAKAVAEKTAAKAAKNSRIRSALKKLIEDLVNYGTRGDGSSRLRRNLQEFFKALTEADLWQDAMSSYLKGLSGWDIFWLVVDLLLAFTPTGWVKKGAEIGLALGGLTYHVHHKYETWKKGKETSGAH